MGRIKTKLVKRTGKILLKKNPDKFTSSFEANKKSLIDVADIPSKKLRNVVAGYITRLVKEEQKQ